MVLFYIVDAELVSEEVNCWVIGKYISIYLSIYLSIYHYLIIYLYYLSILSDISISIYIYMYTVRWVYKARHITREHYPAGNFRGVCLKVTDKKNGVKNKTNQGDIQGYHIMVPN